jgi:CRP/FNR family nitrogen fixation transcriptional regulator
MGVVMSYPRDAEVVGENEPAKYLYKFISGGVRSFKIYCDGRRQIRAFHFPGDIFDLERADKHTCSAEAIAQTKVLVIKRKAVMAAAIGDAAVAQELFDLVACELRRVQERVPLLVKSAKERVASFLLEMAERRFAEDIIDLPMSRYDLADYLGLTIGSISRTLTSLETCGVIEVRGRRIVLRNRSELKFTHG